MDNARRNNAWSHPDQVQDIDARPHQIVLNSLRFHRLVTVSKYEIESSRGLSRDMRTSGGLCATCMPLGEARTHP